MNGWIVKFHPEFFADLKRLDRKEQEIVAKHVEKVKRDPLRQEGLKGRGNCYKVRAGSLRLLYSVRGRELWFLIVERRDDVYANYLKRLLVLEQKIG